MLGIDFDLSLKIGLPYDVAVIVAIKVSLHFSEQKAPTPSLTAPDFSGCLSHDLGKMAWHWPHLTKSTLYDVFIFSCIV